MDSSGLQPKRKGNVMGPLMGHNVNSSPPLITNFPREDPTSHIGCFAFLLVHIMTLISASIISMMSITRSPLFPTTNHDHVHFPFSEQIKNIYLYIKEESEPDLDPAHGKSHCSHF